MAPLACKRPVVFLYLLRRRSTGGGDNVENWNMAARGLLFLCSKHDRSLKGAWPVTPMPMERNRSDTPKMERRKILC